MRTWGFLRPGPRSEYVDVALRPGGDGHRDQADRWLVLWTSDALRWNTIVWPSRDHVG